MRIFAGAIVIWGVPGTFRDFIARSEPEIVAEYERQLRERPRRERKRTSVDPRTITSEQLANVRWPNDAEEPTALTLFDVILSPVSAKGGLRLPTLRVPLACINAWWFAGAEAFSEKEATQFFVGFEEFFS